MRWRKRHSRVVKRFALLPIKATCNETLEWRWLEIVYLNQIRDCFDKWFTTRFVTKEEYEGYISHVKKEQNQ